MWAILWQVIQRCWLLEDNIAEEVTGFHSYTTEEHLEPTEMYGFLQEDIFMLSCLLLLVCPFFMEIRRLFQTEISQLGFDTKEFTRRNKRVMNRSKSWRDGLLQTRKVHNMKPKRRPKILPLFSMESIKIFAFFLMAEKVTPSTTETPTVEQDIQCLHNQEEKSADVRKPRKKAFNKKKDKKQPKKKLWSPKNRYGHVLGFHGFGVKLRPRPSLTDIIIFVCQNMKSGQTKTSPSPELETPTEVSVHEEKVIPVRQKEETARPIPCPTTQDHSEITCPHSCSICSCSCGRNPRLEMTEQLMSEFWKELEKVKNQTKGVFSNVKGVFSNVTKSQRGESSDRKMSQWLREQIDNRERTVIKTSVRDSFNNIPRNIAGAQRFSGQRARELDSITGKESRRPITPKQQEKKKQHPKRGQEPKDSRYNIQSDDYSIRSCCLGCFSFLCSCCLGRSFLCR